MVTIEEVRASTQATIPVKTAAQLLGVDVRTVLGELSVHGGSIPSVSVGRRRLIPREPFLRWLDSGSADTASEMPDLARVDEGPDPVAIVRARLLEVLASLDEPRPAA